MRSTTCTSRQLLKCHARSIHISKYKTNSQFNTSLLHSVSKYFETCHFSRLSFSSCRVLSVQSGCESASELISGDPAHKDPKQCCSSSSKKENAQQDTSIESPSSIHAPHSISFYLDRAVKFQESGNIVRACRYYQQAALIGSKEAHYEIAKIYLNLLDNTEEDLNPTSADQNLVQMTQNGKSKLYYINPRSLQKMKLDEKFKLQQEESDRLDSELLDKSILKNGLKYSRKRAHSHLQEAIQYPPPHEPSMVLLGRQLIFTNSREQNLAQGLELLLNAAENFSGPANYALGEVFFNGVALNNKARRRNASQDLEVIEVDKERAMSFFERSAFLQDRNGLYFYGVCRYWGENGVERNLEEGIQFITEAAKQNHPNANYFLSSYFKEKNDLAQSEKYLQEAIRLNCADAIYIWAHRLLEQGKVDLALQNFEIASQGGSRDATFCAGVIYYRKRKFIEAFQRYSKAGQLGSLEALEAMLDMVRKGQGVEKDEQYIEHLEELIASLKG